MKQVMRQFDYTSLSAELSDGISYLKLDIDMAKQEKMLDFLELLVKWNQAYNLSGIKEPQAMLRLHLLDSLSILPYIRGKKILDVGTGAGIPGLLLAICLPQSRFSLLDSNGKKMRFVYQSVVKLKLENVDIVQQRVESYQSQEAFDTVLSRAFSTLKQFIEQSQHLLATRGRLLAMKGQYPEQEIAEMPTTFRVLALHELSLPGEPGSRHLLELGKTD